MKNSEQNFMMIMDGNHQGIGSKNHDDLSK
jgi:hypothetical protein